ncbi:MAG TPA: hypothetical protein VE553_03410 [Candidatus Binatia bacterium]|jgi:hypothetical protein|nr:hypothetical protein [Candidatus Binatia bacterium]
MGRDAMADLGYEVRRRCEVCGGRGAVPIGRCLTCGREVAPGNLEGEAPLEQLPCGHGIENYVERIVSCQACSGSGHVYVHVSHAEYQAYRHKRLLRGVALLGLALVPMVALLWAVLSAEPGTVCGSWWYGLLLPLFTAGARAGA